jgi:hypothetical protein
MILEEAYSRNPKPDKQARLEIVERVSLNEKEVQVWAEIEPIDDAFLSARPWVAPCLTGFVFLCRFGSKTVDKMIVVNRVHFHHRKLLPCDIMDLRMLANPSSLKS